MTDTKTEFDALLATTDDAFELGELLQEELEGLKGPYRIFETEVDVPRLALLAGATRDHGLWLLLVRYLTEQDGAHRSNQKYSGTPKEDLGPFADDDRSSKWVLSKAKHIELPEPVRARIYPVLEEWEREFARRPPRDPDEEEEEVEPDNPWWMFLRRGPFQ